jgi:oligosaccharyltransferase complex subunit alpha (ribophorin I)
MHQHVLKDTNVVRGIELRLPAGASDVYYKDFIGNVSTSHLRDEGRKGVVLETKPRYPLYGGWKYDFFYGFNVPSTNFLSIYGEQYELKVNVFDTIKNVSYNTVDFVLQMPEGARYHNNSTYSSIKNIDYKWSADIKHSRSYSFLDSVGRPTLLFSMKNVIDEHAGPVVITYSYPIWMLLLKPIAVAAFLFGLFVCSMIYTRVDFSIEVRLFKTFNNERQI